MSGQVKPLQSIQVLRAMAAMLVLIGHVQHQVVSVAARGGDRIAAWVSWPGGFGVDLFFCISGFIIVLSARKMFGMDRAGVDFMARRLIRVVPLYWLATLAYLPVFLLGATTNGRDWLLPLIASLSFVPLPVFGDWASPYPMLTLGWSLNYEMFFYACMALVLTLGTQRVVLTTSVLIGGMVVLGMFLTPEHRQLHFLTRPIMLEFVVGAALGMAHIRGLVRIGGLAAAALLGLAISWVVLDPLDLTPSNGPTPNDFVRLAGWGAPAALALVAVIGAVSQWDLALTRWASPIVRLGDASYSLYLLHPFVLILLGKFWLMAGLQQQLPWWSLAICMVVASWCVARVSYQIIELKASAWLAEREFVQRRLLARKERLMIKT